MMYFLAILITVFFGRHHCASIELFGNTRPRELALTDLSFLDLLPLSAATADDNPNLMSANLDQSLNFLNPSTLSFPISQLPGANSDETLSVIDPFTAWTTAQSPTDASVDVCDANRSTGQKVQKRQDSCQKLLYFISRPESPPVNYAAHKTEEDKSKDWMIKFDKKWLDKTVDPRLLGEKRVDAYEPLIRPGEEWCQRQSRGGVSRLNPVCCLGPEEFITVPTLGLRRVRRQDVTLMNVHNCAVFLVGRPLCDLAEERYCCRTMTFELGDWGFTALDCTPMTWEVNRAMPVRPQA